MRGNVGFARWVLISMNRSIGRITFGGANINDCGWALLYCRRFGYVGVYPIRVVGVLNISDTKATSQSRRCSK